MSVNTIKSLETYKGIKKRENGLADFFVDLKYNKKSPKYNYHSGLTAGMMTTHLIALKTLLKSEPNKKIFNEIFENHIYPLAKMLVESYNWKIEDLTNLAQQFFGEQDD